MGHDIEMVSFVMNDSLLHKAVIIAVGDAVAAVSLPAVQLCRQPLCLKVLYPLPAFLLIAITVKSGSILLQRHIGGQGIRNLHHPAIALQRLPVAEAVKQGGADDLGNHVKLESALRHHMIPAGRIKKQPSKGGSQHEKCHEERKNAYRNMA